MNNAQKHIKAQNHIEKALRELNSALELLGGTIEYNQRADIFHASTVSKYNKIITASLTLNEAQKL